MRKAPSSFVSALGSSCPIPFRSPGNRRKRTEDAGRTFLNSLLPEPHRIADLSYGSNEHLGRTPLDRGAVFDLYCQNDRGDRFVVEIQKVKQKHFKDRSVFYSTFPIQEQAQGGTDWNYSLSPVYLVVILDFMFQDGAEDSRCKYEVKLVDTETFSVFYDKLTFIYLEIPKFKKAVEEIETPFEKWMYVFRHLARLTSRPAKLQGRIFERLFEAASIARLDPSSSPYPCARSSCSRKYSYFTSFSKRSCVRVNRSSRSWRLRG
jgi:predicted transposase/invertase (TIGR01784 family)